MKHRKSIPHRPARTATFNVSRFERSGYELEVWDFNLLHHIIIIILVLFFIFKGFIYIATVSVLPELLEGATLKQSAMEILALVVGIASMVLIAQYE